MRYLLIVFASRRDSAYFLEKLQADNIPAEMTSTPRRLNLSCGISVRTSERYVNRVQRILYTNNFRSFSGIYLYDGYNYYPYK